MYDINALQTLQNNAAAENLPLMNLDFLGDLTNLVCPVEDRKTVPRII